MTSLTRRGWRVVTVLAVAAALAAGFFMRTPMDRALLDGRLACDHLTQTCTTNTTERP